MSARLFAAVDLTDDARARVRDAVAGLRATLRAAGMETAFRWVAPENLHLTLRFLGDVDEAAVPDVVTAMSAGLDAASGGVTLGGLGTFPPSGRPRVLHAAVIAGAPRLAALRDQVDRRLSAIGTWKRDTRPFTPHLTLARARDRARFDLAVFRAVVEAAAWPEVPMAVTRVTLFRSVTRPSGPEYSVLAQSALRSR